MHRLKPWQIIITGVVAVLSALFVVTTLAHLGYALLPGAWGLVAAFQLVGTGATWFFVTKPFVDGYLLRNFLDNVNGR